MLPSQRIALPTTTAGAVHPEYDRMLPSWRRVRDAEGGRRAILESIQDYIPKPGGMDAPEYTAYTTRAAYYAAFSRTIDALLGVAMRHDPTIESNSEDLDDITLTGQSVTQFTRALLAELLTTNRAAVHVDYDEDAGRPFWSLIKADDLRSWRYNGRVLDRVTIHRMSVGPDAKNVEFGLLEGHELVVFDREPSQVRTFALTNNTDWKEIGEPSPLTVVGDPLDVVPVRIVGGEMTASRPPLLGLADEAVSHFRVACDLYHALHWAANPIPYMIGASRGKGEGEAGVGEGGSPTFVLGSAQMLDLPTGAGVGMLEFTGAGCEQMRMEMGASEARMAALGARVLSPPRQGIETAEALRLKSLSDTSLLSKLVGAASDCLTWALQLHHRLAGTADEKAKVELSRDFWTSQLDPEQLVALVAAWQKGAVTTVDLARQLRLGGVAAPAQSDDEIAAAIEAKAEEQRRRSDERLALLDDRPEPDDPDDPDE